MAQRRNSDWPQADREIVLTRLKESEARIMSRLDALDTRVQGLQSSELLQEGRLKTLEEAGRVAGRHAGVAWGGAGSVVIGIVIWALQQLDASGVLR